MRLLSFKPVEVVVPRFIDKLWYGKSVWRYLLLPISKLYGFLAKKRRKHLERDQYLPSVTTVIVGNISVGGTGKTPLLIALVDFLQQQGKAVGVISRGYKGKAIYPYAVTDTSTANECGDEPLLIYKRTGCPVMVDPDRVRGVKALVAKQSVDVILSDDGLQHYQLGRHLELCVIDGARGLGNGLQLPAGPLRELPERLDEVDAVLINGQSTLSPKQYAVQDFYFQLSPNALVPVGETKGSLLYGAKVHAVAGIGNPERFFETLQSLGFSVVPHSFPDHHDFTPRDLEFEDGLPIIMTEKDYIKCYAFGDLKWHWMLPVNAVLSQEFCSFLNQKIK